MLIFSFPSTLSVAKKTARILHVQMGKLLLKPFPDGETYMRFLTSVKGENVVLFHNMDKDQNQAIVDLLLAVGTARDLGAKSVHVVVPYLAYMRQDIRFNPGESVSAYIIGGLLKVADSVITVNTHLHRIPRLSQVMGKDSLNLSAAGLLGEYAQRHWKLHDPVFIGPDGESKPLAEEAAAVFDAPCSVFTKVRLSPRKVKTTLTDVPSLHGRDVVIVDDMITTGHTIVNAINLLKPFKPRSFSVLAVHGLFREGALSLLRTMPIKHIATTNTILSKVSTVEIAPLLAEHLRNLFK